MSKIIKKISFFILNLCFVLFFSFCSKKIENNLDVFRYNEYRNITSLDPAFARNPQNIWPVNQIFNGLVQLDDSLNIIPDIAKSWKISANGLNYIFNLRDDVFFHNSEYFEKNKTRKVIASDFTFSLNRLKDKNFGSPGSWVLQNVKHFEALNDSTFTLKLKNPFPAFLGILSMKYCSVVPFEVVNALGENFSRKPIGTGPYYMKKWNENVKLVLRKNKNYFENDLNGNKLPYLESIAIQFISDIQSEFMLFIQGKLDFINSIDSSYKDELLTPQGNLQPKYKNKLTMHKGPYLNTEYIGFYLDSKSPVINSKKIREAINIGFDRDLLIRYLRNNIGNSAQKGIIPNGLKAVSENDFEYNPIKAKNLVNEFIKESGIENPEIRIATDSNYVDLCEFLQKELENIGINVKIDIMPTSILRKAKSSGNLEMFRASWIADYPDAENYLSLFYSKNFSPNGPNYTHYKNLTFDSLYEKTFKIKSSENRIKLYKKMDSIMINDYPIVPLYFDEAIRFSNKNLKDFNINALNLLNLKKVRKIN
tara:strand:+ start:352 stop:1962 length:1611 start_codon:yes stop_codon:yes gene_type:complete